MGLLFSFNQKKKNEFLEPTYTKFALLSMLEDAG